MTTTRSIDFLQAPPELDRRLDDIIVPQWWNGTPAIPADRYEIDAGGAANLETNCLLAREMRRVYDEVGLVHVRNTGLTELSDMRTLAMHCLPGEMVYEGGSNPRESLEKNVFEVGAPLSAHLHYHHEMAYVAKSTRALAFLCKEALPDRGATYFSDGLASTDFMLSTELGQKLKELGVCYHRNLTDREAFADKLEIGVYNHWQLSMFTDDPAEAEAYAAERGLLTEWGPNRLLKTKYYCDAFEYDPITDRNLFYCSIADHGMWFDGWPMVMHLPHNERPLHMTFGDDSEFSRDELQQMVSQYDNFGIKVDWRQGEVAVFDNFRFAHGRPGIELEAGEARQLGVMLGPKYDRVGPDTTKW
ncbi:MAG: alpha-ketoglutarate-dependent taurine dioxygenase [Candidatus Aldehydirespiratoraceae bacterium]|jgi:alpha-ketoglutarate-dependent taurine dioxygenase